MSIAFNLVEEKNSNYCTFFGGPLSNSTIPLTPKPQNPSLLKLIRLLLALINFLLHESRCALFSCRQLGAQPWDPEKLQFFRKISFSPMPLFPCFLFVLSHCNFFDFFINNDISTVELSDSILIKASIVITVGYL